MTPFETYCLFLALKNHFTTESYDFFKYKGKTSATVKSFEARNDRFFFQKLSRKYSSEQMPDMLVSNLLQGKKWVGDFLADDAEEIYFEYVKVKDSFTYIFKEETEKLFTENTVEEVFRCKQGKYPIILEKCLTGEMPLAIFVVLNDFFGFFDKLDKKVGKDDVIWSKIRLRCNKLRPFLVYDKQKLKEHLKTLVLNTDKEEQT